MNNIKGVTVHKEGAEGTILVDPMSGKILTPTDQQPDWCEGLATCLIQERISFYERRFGTGSAGFNEMMSADAVEFSDLGWLGVDAAGDEMEVFADPAYRSEVVAKVLGIDTESGAFSGTVLAEREVSRENMGRTQSEIEALEQSQGQGFQGGERANVENERATGTQGARRS